MGDDISNKVTIHIEEGDSFTEAVSFLIQLERANRDMGPHPIFVEGPGGLTVPRSQVKDAVAMFVSYSKLSQIMEDVHKTLPVTKYRDELPYLTALQILADRHVPALLSTPTRQSRYS